MGQIAPPPHLRGLCGWGVRGGGLVVGYLVTPGPGQPPALTPARQPLMGNSLTPSLQVLARRKKKSGVSGVLQRTQSSKSPYQEIKVFLYT
jgi:hypothetical protein